MTRWPTRGHGPTSAEHRAHYPHIEDVISTAELQGMSDRYKKVAGFDRETLRTRASFV